jgi:hypothetical protein
MVLLEAFERAVKKRSAVSQRTTTSVQVCWKAMTDHTARKLVQKYQNDLDLWNRFWQFMAEQSERGAPFEYVLDSYDTLEQIWQITKSR